MTARWFFFSLAFLLLQLMVVQGQSTEGFISIACGLSKEHSYNDSSTGLPYISDYEFIETGESHLVSNELFYSNDPTSSLRSFPNGSRNCYTIKSVIKGVKYIVRARFRYGNYDGKNKFPRFDLYLGINYWDTVPIQDASTIQNSEIVVVTTSNYISICLVNTNQGIPFISAIELRSLPNNLYLEANASQSLIMEDRLNIGGSNFSRYPDDIYDRFWYLMDIQSSGWKILNTTSSVATSVFKEPSDVMKTTVFPVTGSSLNFTYSITSVGTCPTSRAYLVMYFAELEELMTNASRIYHVQMNGAIVSDDIQPKYLETTTFDSSKPSSRSVKFSVSSLPGSTEPPILNALELYSVLDLTCQSETLGTDVNAMMDVKAFYKVKRNWNGDPCSPKAFIWEGLKCSYNGSSSSFVTSLNLSSSVLSGVIASSLGDLSALQYLDLSNNSLMGEIPDSLSSLSQLKYLNLANNNLSGSLPEALHDLSIKGYLNLRTEGNPYLCSNPDSCMKKNKKNSNVNSNVLIAIIASVVSVVVLLVLLIVVWRHRRRKSTVSVPSVDVPKEHGLPSLHLESTKFTFKELVKITDNFSRQIGRGGFGPVYHGILHNDIQVAVKMLSHSSSQGAHEFQTEAKLLTRIHHRNLVPLIGYCDDVYNLLLVYEYMEGGNLQDNLSGKISGVSLSWRDRLRISCEAAQGLEYLHKGCKPSIVHRDVKTSNILLTRQLEARIADFGLSKIFQEDGITHMSTRVVGTPGYLDPEYNFTNQLNEKSDVYSFGIVLMELITGLPAIIRSKENIHITNWIQQRLSNGDIKEIVDQRIQEDYDANSAWKVVEIARACVATESLQRPSMSEVVTHLKDGLEINMACESNPTSIGANQYSGCFISNEAIPLNHPSVTCPDAR